MPILCALLQFYTPHKAGEQAPRPLQRRLVLFHHVTVGIHVVFRISDHAFHHFAADGTGLTRCNVTVVTLLEIHDQGIRNITLKAQERRPIPVQDAIALVRHSFSPPAF